MKRLSVAVMGVLIAVSFGVYGGCAKKVPPTTQAIAVEEEPVVVEETIPEEVPVVEEEPIARQPAARLRPIFFDFDRSAIRTDARQILEENARWFRSNPGVRVKIEGHCDERGTTEYNLALGQRRAEATKRVLAAMGVDDSRISTISYGEERPTCRESHEGCWQNNRRSEFTVQ